jgi:hypothetical protein
MMRVLAPVSERATVLVQAQVPEVACGRKEVTHRIQAQNVCM